MILLRCNANARVGMGHLVRCRVLAQHLKAMGHKCAMVGPSQAFRLPVDGGLFEAWIERPDWTDGATESNFFIATATRLGARHAILDDYRSDGAHQNALREAGLICLQQYDASKPQNFAANFVMNSSPSERAEIHKPNFLRPDIQMLLGPSYAIIRPEFLTIKPRPAPSAGKRILLSFGGGDDRGAIAFCLEAFGRDIAPDVQFIIMVGQHNPSITDLKRRATELGTSRIDLQINPEDAPGLIDSCDGAILSGGTTTFEAAYCGLPMLLMPIAPNQYRQCEGWAQLGAATYVGPKATAKEETLRAAFSEFIGDHTQFANMSQIGQQSVDGHGIDRVLEPFLKDFK